MTVMWMLQTFLKGIYTSLTSLLAVTIAIKIRYFAEDLSSQFFKILKMISVVVGSVYKHSAFIITGPFHFDSLEVIAAFTFSWYIEVSIL